jgi:hypothetical protein
MPWLGMARGRDDRATRHRDDGEYLDERERRHRRHKSREHHNEPTASTRERRERRRADDARRQAELDIEDLRARRESYYSRNEAERRRDRDRAAQDSRRAPVKDKSRSSRDKEVRRDSTRKPKRREVIADDHSDDFVFGRPKSYPVEEVTVRRSSGRKRSEEGGSSSRTAYTPHSGSGSASVRRVEVPPLTRLDPSPLVHVA